MKRVSRKSKQKSLQDVYLQFSAKGARELQSMYMRADQKLMRSSKWDHKNNNLLPNRIKSSLEKIGLSAISNKKEKELVRNLLWFWYHHAISSAIWRYGDKTKALVYARKALKLQTRKHPNRITRLLYLLICDDLPEAERWTKSIATEPEKTTAAYLLRLYREGKFFSKQTLDN